LSFSSFEFVRIKHRGLCVAQQTQHTYGHYDGLKFERHIMTNSAISISAISIRHHKPQSLREHFAYRLVRFMRFFADAFFANRYGHRAVILETVAAVPGMVGGALQHLRSLRRMKSDGGWIHTLLDEAENERMHLMTFIEIAQPSRAERWLILFVQGAFYNFYFVLYLFSPQTAHRIVGYLEEEAVYSYTEYLAGLDNGTYPNVAAPQIAIDYWKLAPNASLRDVVLVVRADEAVHRDVNHQFADALMTHSRS
jgi:ubiquinol oxidase